jgi:RNA polymerase sigma-70 factor (ECF subfamily)
MDHSARKLADLVDRHYAQLYRYAYRLCGSEADAEDLTQQAFMTAQVKWDQLRDENCARSWLFTIVRNGYLKQLRAPACAPAGTLDDVAAVSQEPDIGEFDSEQLQGVLNDLPEEFRSPIILFYFQDFSYKEIAEHMQVPIGTVMSRLARAKAFLRQRLTMPQLAASGDMNS